MTEVGENPTLCRNGILFQKQKVRSVKVAINVMVNPEQENALNSSINKSYKIIGDPNSWRSHFTPEEYEEMTDVAERLRAPMDHKIQFQIVDGKLYSGTSVSGDDLLTFSKRAEAVAASKVSAGEIAWITELARRKIETEEIIEVAKLPIGATMLVFSPTPDDILSGAVNIGGYNLTKKTIMVRVFTRTVDGVDTRYISLDGGNRTALTAAAWAIGQEIPARYGSEDILATRFIFHDQNDIAERAIDGYDESMKTQTGSDHSYGRPGLSHKKALDIAIENPARLHDHMSTIRALKWQYSGEELDKKLEEARYNYAAALDRTERGEVVVSNEEAGYDARDSGEDFSGICAGGGDYGSSSDSSSNGSGSTGDAYGNMYGSGQKVDMTCPFCKERTNSDPCKPVCQKCHSTPGNDKSAEYFAKKKAATEKNERETDEHESTRRNRNNGNSKVKLVKNKKQEAAIEILRTIKKFHWGSGIFDSVEEAVNYHGEVVAVGKEARKLYEMKYDLRQAA